MRRTRTPEVVSGRVNSDGSVATGDSFSCVRNSAGSYTVIMPIGFRLSGATCSGYGGASITAIAAVGERFFSVLTYNVAGAATDLSFTFVAVGSQQ
jgi:hypothetical protein